MKFLEFSEQDRRPPWKIFSFNMNFPMHKSMYCNGLTYWSFTSEFLEVLQSALMSACNECNETDTFPVQNDANFIITT